MTKSRSVKKFNKHARDDLEIRRVSAAPNKAHPEGKLRAAATLVDITPAWGVDQGGVGYQAGDFTNKNLGRIFATVVLLDDGKGHRILLVATDLHCGSRYISEKLGACLAKDYPSLGIGVEQTWLMASHTHSGPGHLYGELFYDQLANKKNGFDRATADEIVSRLAKAASGWTNDDRLQPAKLGTAFSLLWGWLWNRSQLGYMANYYANKTEDYIKRAFRGDLKAHETDYGKSASTRVAGVAPPHLGAADLGCFCVDPRIQGIHITDLHGKALATIGVIHATPTVIPAGARCMTGDVNALAASEVRRRMKRPDYPISIVAGAMGDVNIVDADSTLDEFRSKRGNHDDLTPAERKYVFELMGRASGAMADAMIALTDKATRLAKDVVPIETRFGEWNLADAPVGDGRKLAREHAVGKSSLAGSELSRHPRLDTEFKLKKFRENSHKRRLKKRRVIRRMKTSFPASRRKHDHKPKAIADANFFRSLSFFEGVHGGAPVTLGHLAQLRYAKLGGLHLVGWPVEPSVGLAEQLVKNLGGSPHEWILCGLVGGFIGYATTTMEYRVQDYEGASNLWGINFGDWLIARTAELKADTQPKQIQPIARFATFPVCKKPIVSHPRAGSSPQQPPPNAYNVEYDAQAKTIHGEWLSRDIRSWNANESLGSMGWVVQLEHQGQPFKVGDVIVNDVNFPILIQRRVSRRQEYVKWVFDLPLEVPANVANELKFKVVNQKPFTV